MSQDEFTEGIVLWKRLEMGQERIRYVTTNQSKAIHRTTLHGDDQLGRCAVHGETIDISAGWAE